MLKAGFYPVSCIFIDIIQNKINYVDEILSLSKVFQLIDEAFKRNPEFRQFPFSQTKGLSTYPISFQSEYKNLNYFSTHYIDEIEDYDWNSFKEDLSQYCTIKKETINEFVRLVREILRNCKTWSKATFIKVEISRNSVSIIDNSGTYFDIFNPPQSTRIRGGGKTAKIFATYYQQEYNFEFHIRENESEEENKRRARLSSLGKTHLERAREGEREKVLWSLLPPLHRHRGL